jgi:hypothetical protein
LCTHLLIDTEICKEDFTYKPINENWLLASQGPEAFLSSPNVTGGLEAMGKLLKALPCVSYLFIYLFMVALGFELRSHASLAYLFVSMIYQRSEKPHQNTRTSHDEPRFLQSDPSEPSIILSPHLPPRA